jgi:hypothetical protein
MTNALKCRCCTQCDYHCDYCAHKKAQAVVSRWNWNCSPRECADEAKNLEWTVRDIRQQMSDFGFNERDIAKVTDEFENIQFDC